MPAVNDFTMSKSSAFKLNRSMLALLVVFAGVCSAQPAPGGTPAPGPAASTNAVPMTIQTPAATISSGSAAEIQAINESMTVLSAQLMKLDLQAKIAAKRKEILTLEAPPAPAAGAPVAAASANPLGSGYGTPSVVSVSGLKGSLEALLVFSGGVVQRVKVGDVLGDRKVRSIAINNVELTDLKGNRLQRLAFGTTAVTREASSGMPGAPAFPSMQMPPPMPTR